MAVDAVGRQKTIQEIIDSTTNKSTQRNTGELGKDEFLNLLITQLQYQDPLNPVDDKEFISQMAQFSALEQMQNLNKSFSATKAFGMIGKYITGTTSNGSDSGAGFVEGIVRSVKMETEKFFWKSMAWMFRWIMCSVFQKKAIIITSTIVQIYPNTPELSAMK